MIEFSKKGENTCDCGLGRWSPHDSRGSRFATVRCRSLETCAWWRRYVTCIWNIHAHFWNRTLDPLEWRAATAKRRVCGSNIQLGKESLLKSYLISPLCWPFPLAQTKWYDSIRQQCRVGISFWHDMHLLRNQSFAALHSYEHHHQPSHHLHTFGAVPSQLRESIFMSKFAFIRMRLRAAARRSAMNWRARR